MIKRLFFSAVIILAAASGSAGTITNGVWSPSDCGTKPLPPAIAQDSVEAYNKSVKAINEWQQKANAYYSCLISEANTDNSLIADTANAEQANFRSVIQKVQADSMAAKAKLDKK